MKALLWVVVSLVPYLEGKIVVPPWHPDIPFNLKRGNAYPNHPDINYLTNEFTPQGHLSVQNAIRDGQTLPGGHPSLYSFVDHQQPNLDVPRATLPYYHPDITEAYQAAYPLPAGHQLVHDLFKSDIPSNHPNIDDLLRNPRALPFPAWHPDITPYVLHLGPTVLYQLPHWHPDVDYSLSKAFQTPPGHQPVHDILSSLMPADHRNVDDLLAAGTPLPVYHPRVNPLVGQSRDHYATFGCVAMIPSFHPNLEEAYTKNQHVPGNHPKIHDYYKDLLPPNHQNIDDLLATTAADRIPFPAFHPPINRFVAKKPTLSAGILLGIFLVAIVGFLALVRYGQRLQKYVSGTNRGKNKFHDVAMELIPTNETAKEEPPTEKEELTPKKLAENEQQNLAQFEIVESNDLYARRDSRAIFVRPSVDETPAVQLADDDAPKTTPLSSHRSRSMSRSGSVVEGQLHRRSLRMRQASVSQMIRRGEPLYDFPATDPTKPLPPPRAAPYTGELTEKAMQRAELSVLMLRRVPYTDLTIGSVSLMLLYLLLNIIAGVLTNKTPGCLQNPGQEKILGRVFGSLTASNSMVLVILATHNSVLTWILGIPFDHVIVYHRFVGRVVLVLGLIHFLLMLGSQSHSMVIYTGVGALACGGVIGLTTFNWVRRRFFSVFYWAHYSFVGYYVLGFIHVPECRPFLAIGAGFYFLDKLLRALWTLLPRKTLEFVNVGDDLARVRFPKNPLTDMLGLHKVTNPTTTKPNVPLQLSCSRIMCHVAGWAVLLCEFPAPLPHRVAPLLRLQRPPRDGRPASHPRLGQPHPQNRQARPRLRQGGEANPDPNRWSLWQPKLQLPPVPRAGALRRGRWHHAGHVDHQGYLQCR
eukprot:c13161_g1_i2.p1 GENE.c13161_g1_i2~~c13161_g1_i2.p1  ORF type:complete len:865 (-),score=113.46 c13161_g1_i2:442-3036(-)